MTSDHCCLCGQPRRPTQPPVSSFGNQCAVITMRDHRPMQPGRWEDCPQMIVNVAMWRNGGSGHIKAHICDGCIIVGLEEAKRFVERSLAALRTPEMTK